jgi:hypothetical protein
MTSVFKAVDTPWPWHLAQLSQVSANRRMCLLLLLTCRLHALRSILLAMLRRLLSRPWIDTSSPLPKEPSLSSLNSRSAAASSTLRPRCVDQVNPRADWKLTASNGTTVDSTLRSCCCCGLLTASSSSAPLPVTGLPGRLLPGLLLLPAAAAEEMRCPAPSCFRSTKGDHGAAAPGPSPAATAAAAAAAAAGVWRPTSSSSASSGAGSRLLLGGGGCSCRASGSGPCVSHQVAAKCKPGHWLLLVGVLLLLLLAVWSVPVRASGAACS